MQIVIDIPEFAYIAIKKYGLKNCKPMLIHNTSNAIKDGTPLPDDAIIINAKEQSDYVFVEKAKYNDLVEIASKALTDRIKKSLHEGGTDDSEDIPMEYFESGGI